MKERLLRVFLWCICLFIGISISIAAGGYLFLQWFFYLDIQQATPIIVTASPVSQSLTPLSPATVAKLEEVMELDVPTDTSSVVALAQTTDLGNLLVVYADGIFRQWDLQTRKITTEFDLVSASQKSVSFSADGLLAVTPGKILANGSNGYNLWNTQTGERIDCWGPHCPDGDPDDIRWVDAGLLLHPTSRCIIEYDETGAGTIDLENNVLGGISYPEAISGVKFQGLALDKSGMYLAYALDNGSVYLFETEGLLGTKLGGYKRRVFRYVPTKQIRAIGVDDTRTWLGLLSENQITVWDLSKFVFSRQLQTPIDDGSTFAFDRTGDLLAIGTKNGIAMFDLENRRQIAELDARNVTVLYFTQDDRMLVWGDMEGRVHLWGVK